MICVQRLLARPLIPLPTRVQNFNIVPAPHAQTLTLAEGEPSSIQKGVHNWAVSRDEFPLLREAFLEASRIVAHEEHEERADA